MKDSSQQRALAHVGALSQGDPIDRSLRVNLHFHPDRLVAGVPILEAMTRDGVYRSQFETGTSNGGLTAFPGGERWKWESRIFGGAYDDRPSHERPKYGSLNFRRRLHGGSPRFGSAHLRLTEQTLQRTTFCYPDSFWQPTCFGLATRASSVIAMAAADTQDALDDYVEAQVHGSITLPDDVEALVLDPCYRNTSVEIAASRLGCAIEWHRGFRLRTDELERHPEYRGAEFVQLGLTLAQDGHLDARILGDASRGGGHDEQSLKRVWHYVARFGARELA